MPQPTSPTAPEMRHERAASVRLDTFVDGAFAFAITLLVISDAGLPRDIAALDHALLGVPAFAACFAQLAWFWYAHVQWRDDVRLTDRSSLLLSLLLVFFALVFVFPLHLVYSSFANSLSHGVLSPEVSTFVHSNRGTAAMFACYGLSYACMAGTLSALYRHGARTAVWMTRTEATSVRLWHVIWTYVAGVGLLSALVALLVPRPLAGLAGACYFLLALIGPIAALYHRHLKATLPP